jgi:hypothetical protein
MPYLKQRAGSGACARSRSLRLSSWTLDRREAGVDGAEGVADDRTQDHKGRDNNNGNQNKNQRVFDQALAFLLASEQHGVFSFLPNFLESQEQHKL